MVLKTWLIIYCSCLIAMLSIYTFHHNYCKANWANHDHAYIRSAHMHKHLGVQDVYRQSFCHLHKPHFLNFTLDPETTDSTTDTQMTNTAEDSTTRDQPQIIVSLVVPFRNRYEHRSKFLSHMKTFMQSHNFTMFIYFIHQLSSEGFNRGRLFNVGFRVVQKESKCVVVHDIDMLPVTTIDYTNCSTAPIQLSSEIQHWDNSVPYATYTGGVVSASRADWIKINGMSNRFVGWGGEDDELYSRFRYNDLLDHGTGMIRRPPKGFGYYSTLNDADHTERKTSDTYLQMIQWIEQAGRGEIDFSQDGISTNHDIFGEENIQNISDNLYTTMVHVRW